LPVIDRTEREFLYSPAADSAAFVVHCAWRQAVHRYLYLGRPDPRGHRPALRLRRAGGGSGPAGTFVPAGTMSGW